MMDPGIIPRPQAYEKAQEYNAATSNKPSLAHASSASSSSTTSSSSSSSSSSSPSLANSNKITRPSIQHINIGGNVVQFKYCTTCNVFRPPRSFHCIVCDNCVERFDHHCPWIGNCIAERNYSYFILFLVCLSLLCVWLGIWCIWLLNDAFNDTGRREGGRGGGRKEIGDAKQFFNRFYEMLKDAPFAFALVCFDMLAGWFPTLLLAYHTYLTTTNQTTNEQMRSMFAHVSPYSRGCLRNL
ncbi:Zinc finger protein, partial [Reticulomyxa filosa]